LEEAGKSAGTIASYKMEYMTAMGELGEEDASPGAHARESRGVLQVP
jgi:hypothetical protein